MSNKLRVRATSQTSVTDAVSILLNKLGPTEDKVVQTLRRLKCKGIPGSAGHCVVVRFLESKFPKGWDFTVEPSDNVVVVSDPEHNIFCMPVNLPEVVAQVADNFDLGDYPQLVER